MCPTEACARQEALSGAGEADAPARDEQGCATKRMRTVAAAPEGSEDAVASPRDAEESIAAAGDTLLAGGAQGMLVTASTPLARKGGAAREAAELVTPRLPGPAACSLVELGCGRALLMLLAPRAVRPSAVAATAAAAQQASEASATGSLVGGNSGAGASSARAGSSKRDGGGQGVDSSSSSSGAGGSGDAGRGGSGSGGTWPRPRRALNAVDVVAAVLADVEAGTAPRTRFVERLIPIQAACPLQAAPLREAAERVCRAYVAALVKDEDTPLQFAVAFNNRVLGGDCSSATADPMSSTLEAATRQPLADGTAAPAACSGHRAADNEAACAAAGAAPTGGAGLALGAGPPAPAAPTLQREQAVAILAEAMRTATWGHAEVNPAAPYATIIAEVVPVLVAGRWQPLVGLAVADTARLLTVSSRGLQVRKLLAV